MSKHEKIALVTGASLGIGAAISNSLINNGYTVIGIARSWDRSEADPQYKVVCDVSDTPKLQNVIKQSLDEQGRLDLLINNAGIYAPGTLDVSAEDFDHFLRVNTVAPLVCVQTALPYLKKSKTAYVINISSLCGKVGFATIGAYCSTKFALNGLSESLFRELVPQGIRVTALCPSYVATRLTANAPLPQSKMISTQDIAASVNYLVSLSPNCVIKELIVECASDLP